MMKKLFCILPFLVFGCVSKGYKSKPEVLTVMTYNVENLFDALNDKDKNDETYLPLSMKKSRSHKAKCKGLNKKYYKQECLTFDWSDSLINQKMQRLSKVVAQVKNGQGPDVLIMQEVENLNVLTQFKTNHLSKMGYKEIVHIEGPDLRGIDVAIFSKLPLKSTPKLHIVDLKEVAKESGRNKKDVRPTRGILEAQFVLNGGRTLTVLGVHFPSQGSPTPYRKVALKKLNAIRKTLPKNAFIIAAGDFNITTREDREHQLLSSDEMKKLWKVSHNIGCKDCPGTHSYRGEWSFLDVMLFSNNFMFDEWSIDKASIRTPNKSIYQVNGFGSPARFNGGRTQLGVSDHWPLAVDIKRVVKTQQ